MLKIGMIAPPWLKIPPAGYGGIETVIYDLTEGLVKRHNKVLLFAPGDSVTSTKLFPNVPKHLGQDLPISVLGTIFDLSAESSFVRAVYEGVDIIHDHTLHETDLPVRVVQTLHGPATKGSKDKCKRLSRHKNYYFVAISQKQKQLYGKEINFAGVVHNGIDAKKIKFNEKKSDYLLFIGRANWEKGLDLAVRVAVKADMKLIMAIKMTEEHERKFYKKEVQPWLDKYKHSNWFKLYGVITPQKKFQLYRKAKATLFTSQWEEPFGLVMTESMACGTPVLALRKGAAPEVIINGKTGFVVDTEEEMVEAVKNIKEINPLDCRKHVERNFSIKKMAKEYEMIYKKITR